MHWINKYLALRHEKGGRGPDKVDCWGLLRLFYYNEHNITLPEYPGIAYGTPLQISRTFEESTEQTWFKVEEPEDGMAVAMSQGKVFHHVGIWAEADGGKVVHCYRTHHVIADTVRMLKIKGFRRIEFYRHWLWPTSSK